MADGLLPRGASTTTTTGSASPPVSRPVAAPRNHTTSADVSRAQIGPYVPGTIPPPRISLRQPENGTTGRIVDKIMAPRRLPHFPPGHTQTVAMYYISYPERPGERELVPFSEILRHVSPRELERWENELPQRAEEEKRRRKREMDEGGTPGMVTRAKRRRTGVDLASEPDKLKVVPNSSL
ncbi:uncharacterized protein B0H64DRAFT_378669 [Chaetomium fimeti]|uniref:Uncharacterized protein n=1 Tax=Chaetomium fimeti TaxID=1854472 RepID=A0AAE0LMA6_9PEZI|nr:hypothetical protein B0H64DRAFT_378669 [Chaetomium fimeti]